MPAPIQRYNDPRLYGTAWVSSFRHSYQWIRTVAHPWHPHCNQVAECAIRVTKSVTGILAMAVTALPALIGRTIQIIHYHLISREKREHPAEVVVQGMHLPYLEPCPLPAPKKFHGTAREGAIGILRWGFDPSRTAAGAKMGDAVYVSANDVVSAAYGQDQLILSLDLREGEVAYISDANIETFERMLPSGLTPKFIMAAVRTLCYQNGYRAIRYDLDHYGREEAWAVYDPSCISIQGIRLSPVAAPISLAQLV